MKPEIHPEYKKIPVQCTCGSKFDIGSTFGGDNLKIEVCSSCHPFFTGKQKIVDTAGRVDSFNNRYLKKTNKTDTAKDTQ